MALLRRRALLTHTVKIVKWVWRTEGRRDGDRGNCASLPLRSQLKVTSILYMVVTYCTGRYEVFLKNKKKKKLTPSALSGGISECGGVNGVLKFTWNEKWRGRRRDGEKRELRGRPVRLRARFPAAQVRRGWIRGRLFETGRRKKSVPNACW